MDSGSSIFGGAPTFGKKSAEKPESTNIFGSSSSTNLFKPSSQSIFRAPSFGDDGKNASGFLFGKKILPSNTNEFKTPKNDPEKNATIVCDDVPESVRNKPVLESHFRKFGTVNDLSIKDKIVVVHYDDHESAQRAKAEGSVIDPNAPPIKNIFYNNKTTMSTAKQASMPPPSLFATPPPPVFAFSKSNKDNQELPTAPSSIPSLFQHPPPKQPEDINIFKMEDPNVVFKPKRNSFSFKSPSVPAPTNPSTTGSYQSDQERYEALTARNAQLRKSIENGDKGVLIGDCPDMCPETERYRRFVQSQLRVYEKRRDGSANHKAIVKEYSRSSADQDVPLSCELRPGKVLSRTMDHILCNIVDRIDVNRGAIYEWFEYLDKNGTSNGFTPYSDVKDEVGEWFEFLWSATRAIRKDITQQRLVDLEAVDLVEKCARFHIVCSERLVEAESRDFSLKLNDENLTKCLQTLQHLYYDLALEGTSCSNEPEFRAYEILMNANNGDVLRRVSTLNNEVRRSEPVRFGLKIVHAIHSNNYVRFFKLVDEATLLQSCILLRYFNQVRSKAAETLAKAYCPNKTTTQFELSNLTNMLGFEDEFEASEFFASHGATVYENLICMSKPNFMFPEEVPLVRRPLNRIECKKMSDWSLVIHGGPSLPPNPYITYVPCDSFSGEGAFLKPETREFDELRFSKLKDKALITGLSNDICNVVVDEEALKIGNEVIVFETQIKNEAEVIFQTLLAEAIQETMEESLREARNEEILRRIRRENEINASNELLNDYMYEFVSLFCREIGVAEMEIVEKGLRLKHLLGEAEVVIQNMIEDYVMSNVRDIAAKLIQEEEVERELKVQDLIHRREKRLKMNVYQIWKQMVAKEKKRKKILNNFPSTPSLFRSLSSQNDKLSSSAGSFPVLNLSEVIRSMKDTDSLFKFTELEDDYFHKTLLEPLDFPRLIQPILPDEGSIMKVLLSSGDLSGGDTYDKMFFEIIKKKFSFKPDARDELVLSRSVDEKCSIIVRSLTQDNLLREIFYDDQARKRYLNGTTGIIFFFSNEENKKDVKNRMNVLLKNLPKSTGIPLALLTNAPGEEAIVSELKNMCDNGGMISEFKSLHFSDDPFDLETPLRILDAMKFMAKCYPKDKVPSSLKFETLRSYLDNITNAKFYKELYFDLRTTKEHRNPRIIIEFYNSVIDFVINLVQDQSLTNISWPVPEISCDVPVYWDDDTYKDKLIEVLKFVKLPKITDPSEIGDDWSDASGLVCKYFNSLTRSYGDTTPFLSEIRRILLKAYKVGSISSSIPWAKIINSCIEYKMSLADTSDPFDDSLESKRELMIVYDDDKSLGSYTQPNSWRKLNRRDPHLTSFNNTSILSEEETSDHSTLLKDSSSTIHQEVEASKEFERKLMEALKNDREPSLMGGSHDDSSYKEVTECYDEEDSTDHPRGFYEREYVPMVSYLSPSLGAAVSPHRVTKRLEIVMTGKSPNFSSRQTRIAEKRKIDDISDSKENIYFTPKKMSIDRMLESLQSKVSGGLNDSRNFDEKLLNATIQSSP